MTRPAAKPAKPAAPAAPPLGSKDRSVQGHIARKPESLRPIYREVLALVQQVAPDATVDRRFGVLVCHVQFEPLCTIKTDIRKKLVYLVLDQDGIYPDPEELLLEHGWIGRCYLELRPEVELPRSTILGCFRADVKRIRRRRARR